MSPVSWKVMMKRTKERDHNAEKLATPDRREVICPLVYHLANVAVNYDLTWQPETKITVMDDDGGVIREVTGVWKSNPVLRGHTQAFQRELQRMRESEEISWNESAYYFTHEEGVKARKSYENEVLHGRIKAHFASWGPNPKRAKDKSRFHKFTGVTYEELTKKFPDLYNSRSTTSTKLKGEEKEDAEPVSQEKAQVEETSERDPVIEPTNEELAQIDEEAKVAAATAPEATIEDLIGEASAEDELDDHDVIPLYVPSEIAAERIDVKNESIVWQDEDGHEHQAYLMPLPEINTEMWLEAGEHLISGVKYSVRIEE